MRDPKEVRFFYYSYSNGGDTNYFLSIALIDQNRPYKYAKRTTTLLVFRKETEDGEWRYMLSPSMSWHRTDVRPTYFVTVHMAARSIAPSAQLIDSGDELSLTEVKERFGEYVASEVAELTPFDPYGYAEEDLVSVFPGIGYRSARKGATKKINI